MAKAPSAAPEQAPSGKKNRLKLVVIAVAALLLAVVLSAGGTWLFLSKDKPEQPATAAQPSAQQEDKQAAVYERLEPPFVVNFHADGRTRYMQVSLALMARDPQQLAALKAHMPALRNQLVMLFSSQDFEQLYAPLGLDILKQQVTATVQNLAINEVGAPVVEQVLFTNFVMQ